MRTAPLRALGLAAALVLPAALAGCSNIDRAVATSTVADDYHQRHAVVLAPGRQTLDIFPGGVGGGLDERQQRDLAIFAADFLSHGEGRVRVLVPAGQAQAGRSKLPAVRETLAANGVRGDIELGDYPAAGLGGVAPIRLSFTKIEAGVASRCGEWPEDLGPATGLRSWENQTYYNFGCASQQTLAQQIDDPRDLVRPRAQDPSDVTMRTRAIGNIRSGKDPGTTWVTTNSNIGPVGN